MERSRNCSSPEDTMRDVLDACADCDTCRFLMDESCLLFPELYRLYDQQKEGGNPVSDPDLRKLAESCTLCGMCPCPNIRADVIRSKTERVRNEGMSLGNRLLGDPQRFGRSAGLVPKAVNGALAFAPIDLMVKKVVGIHPHRRLPRIAQENFFAWAFRQGLDREPHGSCKVAYFAGCTAGYFFPEVARAAVAVMACNGISVYVPPQQCCGMPTLLEGVKRTTLRRVRLNMEILLKAVRAGYKLVCSCPTCGFLMKILLRENACYSEAYQRSINAGEDEIKVPGADAGHKGFVSLKKSMYHKIMKDDGYFAELDPLKRIALSENVMDVGEYLTCLHREKTLNSRFGKLESRMAYFAPCHLREQGIGSPYEKLLALIPGLTVVPVGGTLDCCGMGGSLGFKKDFHEASLKIGRHLMQKIQASGPSAVLTDCLSCRLQFQQMLPYPVYHPLEVISRAYEVSRQEKEKD
jgi:glycerol-3-phosphate dehydrogenase subunit C